MLTSRLRSCCLLRSLSSRSIKENNLIALQTISLFHTSRGKYNKRDDVLFRDNETITQILNNLKDGKIDIEDAKHMILNQHTETLLVGNEEDKTPFAHLDHTRASRTGFPEAVFASGKTPQQIASILDDMAANVNSIILKESIESISEAQKSILATRVDAKLYDELAKIPLQNGTLTYHKVANIVSMKASFIVGDKDKKNHKYGNIVVSCAGTTDLPVAEEAAITLEAAGCNVERIYDVGVAGLHRIINALPRLRHPDVDCVIVCAGMDGALPSVVAGLVHVPVVAVPTSIGYGASFNGISAMLTMLNSCSPGVSVVNIDNGFGAAAFAFKCVKNKNKE